MLTNKNKKKLKSISNSINKYNIGKDKISEDLIDMLNKALISHELIKLVFNKSIALKIDELLNDILIKLNAELVIKIGHTAVIYKENKNKKDHIILD